MPGEITKKPVSDQLGHDNFNYPDFPFEIGELIAIEDPIVRFDSDVLTEAETAQLEGQSAGTNSE